MCKLSFEVSAPFTYTSQAQYGHAEVANPMSHWPSSALHCILLDVSHRYNVCVVCIIFFWVQEQAHADNWVCTNWWWVVDHPASSPLAMVSAKAATITHYCSWPVTWPGHLPGQPTLAMSHWPVKFHICILNL